MSETTWTGKSGGDWDNAGNWSSGVPNSTGEAAVVGTFDAPLTVVVGASDTGEASGFANSLSLFDATLAVAGGTLTVGSIVTSDDPLPAALSELDISSGLLTIQEASAIGSFTNSSIIGLTQAGGTLVFQNGSSDSGVSTLAGQQFGVNQTSTTGTIEVAYGTLEIFGNSNFSGTLASAAGAAAGTTGTIELAGGAFYNFNAGVALDVNEVELLGADSTLQINKSMSDQFMFDAGTGTVIQLVGNTLTLSLAALGGTIDTSGTIINTGTIDDSGLTLQNSVLFTNNATVAQNAAIVIGSAVNSATTLDNNATYTLDASGATAMTGTGLFANAGTFTTSPTLSAASFSQIAVQFDSTGTVMVNTGTLAFANNDTFAGTIGGAGEFELTGGGSFMLNAGVVLSSGSVYVSAANGNGQLQLAILGSLTYAGQFLQDSGTSIDLDPVTVGKTLEQGTLTLTNASDLSGSLGGTFVGDSAARLVLASTTAPISDDGLIVRGSMTVEDSGQVSQEGTVTIGLLSGDFETGLVIGQGAPHAIYDFVAPSVLTGDGTITNEATFEQAQQITGTSIVSANFISSASVICKSGTLEFTGSDTFAGTVSGAGLVELSGAVFTLDSSLLVTVSTLEVSSAAGAAQVDLIGNLTYNNSFTQTPGTTLDVTSTLANGSMPNQPTLTLNGISQLNGVIYGLAPHGVTSSEVVVSAKGSASDGGMVLTGAATLLDQGQVGQQGLVIIGLVAGDFHTSVQIATGATYSLSVVSDITGDGSITNYGTFAQLISVTGTSIVSADLVSADLVNKTGTITSSPTIVSNGGILEFTGSDIFHGTISGAATVAFSAASFTFEQDLTVTVAALELTDNVASADVLIASGTNSAGAVVARTLTYAGMLTQTPATTLSLGAMTTLDLPGSGDQMDGTVYGTGGNTGALVQWSGADETDTGLIMTGNVTLIDNGKIGQGSLVTIGLNAGDFSDLIEISAGKLYNLSQQSTIVGAGSILNLGTFEQGVSVTGTSVVGTDFTSNGASSEVLGTTGTLLFGGADTFGGTITGAGAVALDGANFTFDAGIVVTIATLEVGGDLTLLGSLSYAGLLVNSGEITLEPGVTLTLTNVDDVLGSMVRGFGGFVYQSAGSDSGLALGGTETLFDTGFIGQTGDVTIGVSPGDEAALIIDKGAAYNFRATSLLTGNGSVVVDSGGLFGQGAGSVSDTVNVATFTSAGVVVCGTSGTMEFSGSDSFAGTITGAGEIELSGGSFTFDGTDKATKGLAITVSTLDLAANLGAASVTILGTITYGGAFAQAAGGTISFGTGALLTLNGGSEALNGTLAGNAALVIGKAVSSTDDGLTLTGAMHLIDAGAIGQAGGLTIGAAAGDSGCALQIDTGASYNVQNNALIAGSGAILNKGSLLKNGTILGGGTSTIAPRFTNASGATVTVTAGTLIFNTQMENDGSVSVTTGGTADFGGAVSAPKADAGTLGVASNGFLFFGNAVGANQTVSFSDDEGHVVLQDPGLFNGTFSGFQAAAVGGKAVQSDSIDLAGINDTGLTVTYTPTTSANKSGIMALTEMVNGTADTVGTLHFAGTYTLANFAFATDASGTGTLITDPPTARVTAANTGSSAVEFLNVGGATETATLLPAGNGVEQVFGLKLNGLDVLDLHGVLAGAAGDPSLADIGGYITASDSGGSTTLSYDPTGHGHGGAFAVLEGVNTSVAGLLAHHALSLG